MIHIEAIDDYVCTRHYTNLRSEAMLAFVQEELMGKKMTDEEHQAALKRIREDDHKPIWISEEYPYD